MSNAQEPGCLHKVWPKKCAGPRRALNLYGGSPLSVPFTRKAPDRAAAAPRSSPYKLYAAFTLRRKPSRELVEAAATPASRPSCSLVRLAAQGRGATCAAPARVTERALARGHALEARGWSIVCSVRVGSHVVTLVVHEVIFHVQQQRALEQKTKKKAANAPPVSLVRFRAHTLAPRLFMMSMRLLPSPAIVRTY